MTALQAAWAAILHTPVPEAQPCRHLQAALHRAIRIGDDTDTVAAIAGSLLGARWGASAVPVEWRSVLHGKPGEYGRPDYTARDLVRLGVLSAFGGRPDSAGWPEAKSLMPYYERDWPAGPVLVPLAEDPGLLLGNLYGARTSHADVTVSLCRMGRADLDPARHLLRVELGLVDGGSSKNANLAFTFADLAAALVRWRDEDKSVIVHGVRAENRIASGRGRIPRCPARDLRTPGAREGAGPVARNRRQRELRCRAAAALARGWLGVMRGAEAASHDEVRIRAALGLDSRRTGMDRDHVTLGHLASGGLEEALGLMVRSPGRWILIVEAPGHRYVQFLAPEDGGLVAECVSNAYLDDEWRLSEDDEELLPQLGWGWPEPPDQLNWQTVEFAEVAVLDVAVLAVHTLRQVFDVEDEDALLVLLDRSSRV